MRDPFNTQENPGIIDVRTAVGPPMEGILTVECRCGYQGPGAINAVAAILGCPFCVDAFEREDAPWELAVTLGDISVDDEPLNGEWDDDYSALGPYYEPD